MPAANDAQMQAYADKRIRVFAEKMRDLFIAAADHKAAIDDVYARAVSNSRWTDARNDGPPHFLQSGNSASPDDVLVFNSAASLLLKLRDGTFASQAEANGFAVEWAVLQDACVRPALNPAGA
jgi:hypothetical protein